MIYSCANLSFHSDSPSQVGWTRLCLHRNYGFKENLRTVDVVVVGRGVECKMLQKAGLKCVLFEAQEFPSG
jgi:hypothetical protein